MFHVCFGEPPRAGCTSGRHHSLTEFLLWKQHRILTSFFWYNVSENTTYMFLKVGFYFLKCDRSCLFCTNRRRHVWLDHSLSGRLRTKQHRSFKIKRRKKNPIYLKCGSQLVFNRRGKRWPSFDLIDGIKYFQANVSHKLLTNIHPTFCWFQGFYSSSWKPWFTEPMVILWVWSSFKVLGHTEAECDNLKVPRPQTGRHCDYSLLKPLLSP